MLARPGSGRTTHRIGMAVLGVLLSLGGSHPATWAQDAEHSILVRPGEESTGLNLLASTRKNQSLSRETVDGKAAAKITWQPGAGRLAELNLQDRPALLAFDEGVTLEIDLNNRDYPDLRAVGVRLMDADGVIWQFGGLQLEAGRAGWQVLRVDLTRRQGVHSFGGAADSRDAITPPVRLFQLIFNAPGEVEDQRSLYVGDIQRNAVDADAIEPASALEPMEVSMRTALPLAVVRQGEEDGLRFEVSNPAGGLAAAFRLKLTMTDYEGDSHAWTSEAVSLKPGEQTSIVAGEALKATGWWQVTGSLEAEDGSGAVQKVDGQLAYLDLVGTRSLPPADNFWFGLDTRVRSDEVLDLLSELGVDKLRFGTWRAFNPAEGEWRWGQFDQTIERITARSMSALYSITFTPDWAAKPEYVRRREAGEKIGNREIRLGNVPPREEALRQALREVIARTKAHELTVYDLWNEPDLSGFWQGTTDEYLAFMRICYEEIKAVQPEAVVLTGGIATISGHGGHGLNPDMIERMIVEMEDHYDAISVHQHGDFRGFQRGLDGVLAEHRSRLREDKPLWFTETGYNGEPRDVAQVLVQKFALGRARGGKGLIWYALYPPQHRGYNMVSRANHAEPVIPAYNEMVRLMRDKRFAKEHEVGPGNWLFSFVGEDERLYIGWDEDAPSAGREALIRLSSDAEAELLNVMGQPMSMERFENLVFFPLKKDLRYLHVRGGAAVIGSPVALSEVPRGEAGQVVQATATLSNPLTREAVYALEWTLPDGTEQLQSVTVGAGEQAQTAVEVTIAAPSAGGATPELALAYELEGTPIAGRQTVAMDAVRRISSASSDSREADFELADRDHIHNPNEADPTRAHLAWGGPRDLSAKVWLALENDHVVLRVDVADNRHVQSHDGGDIWQADSVQVAIDLPGRAGYWNFGLARSGDGDDIVHVWNTPTGVSSRYGESIALQTTPRAGGLVYEARLPLAGLGADAESLRANGMRLNLVMNDDDGDGRKGFAYIAPGFGLGGAEPAQWPLLLFE